MKTIVLGVFVLLFLSFRAVADTGIQFFLGNMTDARTTWKEFNLKGDVKRWERYDVEFWQGIHGDVAVSKLKTPTLTPMYSREFFPAGRVKLITDYSDGVDYEYHYVYDSEWHLLGNGSRTWVWKNGYLISEHDHFKQQAPNEHSIYHYDEHHDLVEADTFEGDSPTASERWLLTYDKRGDWIRADEYLRGKLFEAYSRVYDAAHRLVQHTDYLVYNGRLLIRERTTRTFNGNVPELETDQEWEMIGTTFDGPQLHELQATMRTTFNRDGQPKRTEVYSLPMVNNFTPETVTKKQLYEVDSYQYNANHQLVKETYRGSTYTLSYDKHGNVIQRVEYRPIGPGGTLTVVGFRDYRISYFDSTYPTGILNDTNVRIRLKPNLRGFILPWLLQRGQKVRILGETAKKMRIGKMNAPWYEIETQNGLIGWSYGAFIDKHM